MAARLRLAVTALSLFGPLTILPACAAEDRVIGISIQLDGKPYLAGLRPDSQSKLAAEIWRYLASTELKPVEGVHVSPEPCDPLKATLRGRIVIDVEHGGKAEVKELRLVRRAADAGWTVHSDEVERIAKETGLGEPPGRAKGPGQVLPQADKRPRPEGDRRVPDGNLTLRDIEIIRMTGPWRVISYEKDGKKTPNEQLERCSSFLECDGKVMVKREGEIIINGTTKMDWTKKPKLVDITFTEGEFDGKKALGIYELDNDSMKLCYAPPGRDRPTELSSKPGSHQVLIIFKKQVISEIPATISPEGTKREPKDDRWSDLLLVIGVIGFCCIVWRLGMWLRKLL